MAEYERKFFINLIKILKINKLRKYENSTLSPPLDCKGERGLSSSITRSTHGEALSSPLYD